MSAKLTSTYVSEDVQRSNRCVAVIFAKHPECNVGRDSGIKLPKVGISVLHPPGFTGFAWVQKFCDERGIVVTFGAQKRPVSPTLNNRW